MSQCDPVMTTVYQGGHSTQCFINSCGRCLCCMLLGCFNVKLLLTEQMIKQLISVKLSQCFVNIAQGVLTNQN